MLKSKAVIVRCGLLAIFLLFVLWLVVASRSLTQLQGTMTLTLPCPAHEVVHHQQQSSLQLPILPTVHTDNMIAANAITEVFHYATELGGWINVNSLEYQDIQQLRDLGQKVMNRDISCGSPKLFGQDVTSGLEYCFWKNDVVSDRSLDNFAFERQLVDWVFREFRDLDKSLQQLYSLNASACPPGILDVGVNVGDWASQLVAALPATPFFGIEGTPSTSAIAAANMRTSIEHRLRSGSHSAAALLLPFSLIPLNMVDTVRATGGLCYMGDHGNVGGQGVQTDNHAVCQPHLIAGGTLMSHALKAIASVQSCPGKQDWPRIYLAKFDIQRFEFKAMTEALHWLSERPPCYILIEVMHEPQTHAIIELLLDIGYDSVWRTHNSYSPDEHEEFPAGPPYWSRSRNRSISLHEAADIDLSTLWAKFGNKDYLFGFEDNEKCVRRLME